jgi:hypothetical protein
MTPKIRSFRLSPLPRTPPQRTRMALTGIELADLIWEPVIHFSVVRGEPNLLRRRTLQLRLRGRSIGGQGARRQGRNQPSPFVSLLGQRMLKVRNIGTLSSAQFAEQRCGFLEIGVFESFANTRNNRCELRFRFVAPITLTKKARKAGCSTQL